MDENGLPSAAASSEAFPATPTPPPSPGAPASTASNSSDSTSVDDASEVQQEGGGSAVTIIANNDGLEEDVDTEVTLCRAPTLACLARACGKAGSEVPVLWEGFGCRAAASLNVTFSCRIGGLEVPAVSLEGETTTSSSSSCGGEFEEEAWGPDWVGEEGGGGLVCEVPRLEWAETGQEESVMVPVEVLWSLPEEVRVGLVSGRARALPASRWIDGSCLDLLVVGEEVRHVCLCVFVASIPAVYTPFGVCICRINGGHTRGRS